ncbi:MAG: alpha/beta hydrolase [Flavisolibacter sp.]
MEVLKLILQILAAIVGCIAGIISIPLFISFRWPAAIMWGIKLFASALSPVLFLVGLLTSVVGLWTESPVLLFLGIVVMLVYAFHIVSVTRAPGTATGFEQAFGLNWENRVPQSQKANFLSSRLTLRLPKVPDPRFERDICFATIPGTGRRLLCDLWLPPEHTNASGLAFVYLHGSAFSILDKDWGTRPFFRHLAAQGHVIMDVAYRLAPETDILGMVQDVKRAIAWVNDQADTYGIYPGRIVVGGGSAGGHLALLAAFADGYQPFTPEDLAGKNTKPCAVISLYGTNDLEALYYHTNQHLTTRAVPGKPKKSVPTKMPKWLVRAIGKNYHRLGLDKDFKTLGTLPPLLGGHPDECPEKYALFSPITHVHIDCPPTLLIHGTHDIMSPVSSTRRLFGILKEYHVPSVLHIIPQSDHGFDLALPNIGPAAHNAIFDVERFLALMVVRTEEVGNEAIGNKTAAANRNLVTSG